MGALASMDIWWTALGCFGLALVSAVVPWVNAEVVMLAATPLAGSSLELGVLVLLVTAGQMIGKSFMYWTSRKATGPRAARVQGAIDRWRDQLRRYPAGAVGVMFVSAAVGLPPFYLVSIVAGALNVAFGQFLAVGTLGRLVHFAAIALAPQLAGWRS